MSGNIGPYGDDDNDSSLIRALNNILKNFKELENEEVKIIKHFLEWSDHRKETIETIEELRNKINDVCVGANVMRAAGAVAGLASIFAGIVGFVLEAKGNESAESFNTFGKYCGGASVVALTSSTLIEAGVSQIFLNKVERVLDKDIELTKPLRKWVELSHKVDSLLEEHFRCGIASHTFRKVMEVLEYSIEALNAGKAEFDRFTEDLKSCKVKGLRNIDFEVALEVAQIVMDFLKRMRKNPELRTALWEMWKIFKETPNIFEFVRLGSMIHCTVYRALNASRLSFLLDLAGIPCPSFGGTFVRIAFDAVTIGANVITLILAARNIKEGKSKYSDALDDIKNALRTELREVSNRMRTRYKI